MGGVVFFGEDKAIGRGGRQWGAGRNGIKNEFSASGNGGTTIDERYPIPQNRTDFVPQKGKMGAAQNHLIHSFVCRKRR